MNVINSQTFNSTLCHRAAEDEKNDDLNLRGVFLDQQKVNHIKRQLAR